MKRLLWKRRSWRSLCTSRLTSTGSVVGQDVKNYPKVPADWYKNKDEQVHITEADWNYVDFLIRVGYWVLKWSYYDP